MTEKQNIVIKHSDVKFENIVYDDFIVANDEKHVVSKIWYKNDKSELHTFYIQTDCLKLCEDPNNEKKELLLLLNNSIFFDDLDKKSVAQVKLKEIHKKYGLIKPTYRSSINNSGDNNDSVDMLKLKIGNCNFFYKNKSPKDFDEVMQLNLLKKGTSVKLIIEVGMIMMNVKQNFIFTNLVLKQAQIQPVIPKIVEITEYSFIDDYPNDYPNDYLDDNLDSCTVDFVNKNNKNNKNNSTINFPFVNIDHVVLNTQTEYENNSNNSYNSDNNNITNENININHLNKLNKLENISETSDTSNTSNTPKMSNTKLTKYENNIPSQSDSTNSINSTESTDSTDSTNSTNSTNSKSLDYESNDVKEIMDQIAKINSETELDQKSNQKTYQDSSQDSSSEKKIRIGKKKVSRCK